MVILIAIIAAVVVLAHTAPAPFVLDALAGRRAVWHMARTSPPTIFLTFDDGPNPTTTPDLLDLLARERVLATFFVIDRHITGRTAPIVRRLTDRVRGGDIIVMHDGDESAPFADQRHTVDATARLIPALRARGFSFGTVCSNAPEPRTKNPGPC